MSNIETWFIKQLMEQIIKDYQTPKISTEVSISSVLSIFIEDIVNHKDIKGLICNEKDKLGCFKLYSKEFPFKKPSNNQSENVDFLFTNNNTLLLVELKTCSKSFSPAQKSNYVKIGEKIKTNSDHAAFLIEDLAAISGASKQELKYKCIYKFLNDNELLNNEKSKFQNIDEVKVIYIGPEAIRNRLNLDEPVRLISFKQLSQIQLDENTYDISKSPSWNIIRKYFLEIEKLDSKYY